MARVGIRKKVARSPHTKKQQDILQNLESTARQLGWTVSAGKLRFADLKLKGGNCLLHGKRWLVLDKNQPFEELVDIFRQAFTSEDLAGVGLADELKVLVAPRLAKEDYSSGVSAS